MQNSVLLQIRKIIFESFNDLDLRFNNEEILEHLKKNEGFDQSMIIDDLENEFKKIEDDGLVRCIAQNFTTKWFKLFDSVDVINCDTCGKNVHLGKEESRTCPNTDCNANL